MLSAPPVKSLAGCQTLTYVCLRQAFRFWTHCVQPASQFTLCCVKIADHGTVRCCHFCGHSISLASP